MYPFSENCGYVISPVYLTEPGAGEYAIIERYSVSIGLFGMLEFVVMSTLPHGTAPVFQYHTGIPPLSRNGRINASGDWIRGIKS
jgi:hypothetical protein